MALTTHLHQAPRSKREYSYTCTPLLGVHSLFSGELHLFIFAMFKVGRQSPGTAELGPTRYRDAAHYGTATVCAGIHPALDDAADCILPDTHVPTYHGHHTSHLLSLFCRSTMLHITIYLLIVLPPTFLAWKMLNACLVYRNEMQCIFQFIFIAQ